jgi:predicted HTH domain antitoxin
MPLIISDDILKEAKLTEADVRLEIASTLYTSGRLSLRSAARLAGLDGSEFSTRMSAITMSAEDLKSDGEYAAGYARIPEDASESSAVLPHLASPDEGWT